MSQRVKKNKQPVIFLGVGIFNTLLDFGFYTLLTQTILQGNDKIALVGVISGTFALLCAFATHGYITWRGAEVSHKTLARFVVFTGFGMWIIRPSLLAIFIKFSLFYGWIDSMSKSLKLPFSYDFIASTGAFGFMVVLVLLYNYFVYSRFVFTSQSTDQESR